MDVNLDTMTAQGTGSMRCNKTGVAGRRTFGLQQ
jgi:hypothetical protein